MIGTIDHDARQVRVPPSEAPSARLDPQVVAALLNAGYTDLHGTIPPGAPLSPRSEVKPDQIGKIPGRLTEAGTGHWASYDWRNKPTTMKDLKVMLRAGGSLGMQCRATPFVDADVLDAEIAAAVEAAVTESLGPAPRRVGRAPKFAMPYRLEGEPFGKVTITLSRGGKVEVLGDGNQVVIGGLHPATMQPYTWALNGGPVGGVEVLASVPRDSLPPISRELVVERLLPALQAKLAPLHVTATLSGGGSAAVQRGDADRAPSVEAVRALVEQMANDADYERYISVGIAIRGACGEEHGAEGLEIWQAWCARGVENHPELNESKWATFRRPALGWEALQGFAREAGVNTGPLVFEADPSVVPTPSLPPYVVRFNEDYALIRRMAGTVLQLTKSGPEFIPIEHWRILTAPEKVEGKAASQLWLTHPGRRVFRQVTMDPAQPPYSPIPVPGDDPDFNIWPGFAVQPSTEGSCDLFLAHLRDVVCSGNEQLFQWVIQWMAAMVQVPERLTGTALVLRGPMGAGKSYVGEVMGRLLGTGLYSKVSKPDELTGRFNSHHQGKILLQVEEGFFAGNRAAVGALKHMITSDRVRIEAKFRDPYEIPNYCRLLITSNEEWVIPAGWSERRFTVIDISGARKDDWEYHAAMRAEMESGGYAKLLHVLLNMPLDFKLLARPFNTAALRDQQLASMEADQRWLYDILQAGEFPDGRVEVEQLYEQYSRFLRDHSAGRRADRAAMGRLLRAIGVRQEKVRQGGGRSRVYVFPPLAQCREAFAVGLAVPPEWDGPSSWPADDSAEALL